MTNLVPLTEPEIALVSGGILQQSVSISVTQSTTSSLAEVITASSPGKLTATVNSALMPLAALATALSRVNATSVLVDAKGLRTINGLVFRL
jgi:hypothetical protein